MLAQLLGKHGITARVEEAEFLAGGQSATFDAGEVRMVCLSFLDTSSPVHVRYAVRRTRRKVPHATMMVGLWALERDDARALCEAARADLCAGRLTEALQICPEAALAPDTGRVPVTDEAGRGQATSLAPLGAVA